MADIEYRGPIPTSGPPFDAALDSVMNKIASQLPWFISRASARDEAVILLGEFLLQFPVAFYHGTSTTGPSNPVGNPGIV